LGIAVTHNQLSEKKVAKTGWSDAQKASVIEELNFTLAHPAFRSSHRCVDLLRHLVHQAAVGGGEGIKERTLGIEVFGRDADYDVNVDPIVRRTANEIRKRLAQCYMETNRSHAVKIHLERGSYCLEFEFAPVGERPPETTEPKTPSLSPGESTLQGQETVHRKWIAGFLRRKWSLGVAVGLLVAVASLLFIYYNAFRPSRYMLWKPLLDSGDRITICLSDRTPLIISGGNSSSQANDNVSDLLQTSPAIIVHGATQDTAFLDVNVAHAISTMLLGFKKQTILQPSSVLKFQDFRQGPTVLIGGANNPWAILWLSKLRYSIHVDPVSQDKWIQDAQNPTMHDWKIEAKPQNSDVSYDYAIITRFFNGETGQWMMVLSGLEKHGTEAAGNMVSDPESAKLLPPIARSKGNFQIVLKISVIRESTGHIDPLAVHSW
jgi:hypothetical protein